MGESESELLLKGEVLQVEREDLMTLNFIPWCKTSSSSSSMLCSDPSFEIVIASSNWVYLFFSHFQLCHLFFFFFFNFFKIIDRAMEPI
jgi:hypothetical protein